MISDPLLRRFEDLNYPGKRVPINRKEEQKPPESQGWDEQPVFYKFKGVEKEFFTISHFAAALGKAPVTIRSWENKGLLPRSPYRSPRPRRESIPGVEAKGKRLWTREQIEGTLRIASEEKVILNGKAPTKRFAQRVTELYISLSQKDSD